MGSFETESIIALVSLLLEIFPDVDITEQYFSQSIEKNGQLYLNNKKSDPCIFTVLLR